MDVHSDLRGAPQTRVPIVHGNKLSCIGQDPGPRLAPPEKPIDSLSAWEFAVLVPSVSQELMSVVQFAVAHTRQYHRYIMEPEVLQCLLRDLVRHAKIVWEIVCHGQHPVVGLSRSLSRFCAIDKRCRSK
eukprot:IDg10417t1